MIKLQIVENPDHVAQAKALFQEYAETRKNDPALEDFHEEIDNLPGKYAAPDGNLILLIVMENWPDVLRCTNWLTVFVK